MRMRKRWTLRAGSCLLALGLAWSFAVPALAEEAAAPEEGEAAVAEEQVPEETRLSNTIGYQGGIDYWAEYENYIENVEYEARNAANAEAEEPNRYVDYYSNTYQRVPNDPAGWNNTYLNADSRGCLSCHTTIEDALIEMSTRHDVYIPGYPTQLTVTNCLSCHGAVPHGDKTSMAITMHGSHTGKPAFEAMGGTCESCHYISPQGEFEMWDVAKYDLYKGFTDVSAEEASIEVSYDQDTISSTEQQFFKSLWVEPSSWRSEPSDEIAEQWIVSIGGEVANPLEVSVAELKEMFGTKTVTLKQNCIANTAGNGWIFQAEFTGISMKDIIEYVQPAEGVTNIKCETEDGYNLVSPTYKNVNVEDCLLVTEINGEPLPVTQGYPLAIAIPGVAASQYLKAVTAINFVTNPNYDPNAASDGKPFSGVLNYPDGVVLPAGETVHLEGYADAFDAPISKIEYSLDHGETWITLETPDNDPTCWTYWRLDFTPENPGAYLLKIRTTCILDDGSELVNSRDTNFLFTVE